MGKDGKIWGGVSMKMYLIIILSILIFTCGCTSFYNEDYMLNHPLYLKKCPNDAYCHDYNNINNEEVSLNFSSVEGTLNYTVQT